MRSLSIYYDGECPFCARYIQLYRLRESDIETRLIDAREAPESAAEFLKMGMDVNEGMIVRFEETVYHGARAMNVLALLSSKNSIFNRINRRVFSDPRSAKILYPILVAGRNLTLWILRRRKINLGSPG